MDLTGNRYFVATTWNKSASRLAALPDRFRKVLESGTTQVFENRDAVPIAFFVPQSGIQVVNDDEEQFRGILSPDFDPRRTVIAPDAIRQFSGARGSAVSMAVASAKQDLDEMRFGVTADQDGLLVFDETYYPGWQAEVDASPAPLVRADYAFMAVPITQGRHDIRFRFAPSSVRTGGFLSGLSALWIALILLIRVRGVLYPALHRL